LLVRQSPKKIIEMGEIYGHDAMIFFQKFLMTITQHTHIYSFHT
jgi:hypothetical protein